MPEDSTSRLDKWLWASRWCKTRSEAAEACRSGAVKKGKQKLKPSYTPKPGEIILFRKQNLWRTLKITKILQRRVSAPLAQDSYEDMTDPEAVRMWRENRRGSVFAKVRDQGRPTKKERRDLGKLLGE